MPINLHPLFSTQTFPTSYMKNKFHIRDSTAKTCLPVFLNSTIKLKINCLQQFFHHNQQFKIDSISIPLKKKNKSKTIVQWVYIKFSNTTNESKIIQKNFFSFLFLRIVKHIKNIKDKRRRYSKMGTFLIVENFLFQL